MKLSKRDRTIFGAMLFLLLAGGLYWFFVKPAQAEVETLNVSLTEATAKLATAQDALTRAKSVKIDEREITTQKFQYAKAIPVGVQTPGAIAQIQAAADHAGVVLTKWAPTNKPDTGGLRTQEVVVDVQGKFFDVDDFIYTVQHLVELDDRDKVHVRGRLFVVTKVEMRGSVSATGATTPVRGKSPITATLTMTAVSQPRPDQPVPAAPAAAGAPATTPAGAPAATPATATPATGGTR